MLAPIGCERGAIGSVPGMRTTLEALLATGRVLLADGATGTNYLQMGLGAGEAPELWNVDAPDKVASLHRRFVDAGADVILTNTFGCNRHRLTLHGAEHRVGELARAAATDSPARSPRRRAGRWWSPARSDRPASCSSRSAR